MLKIGHRGACGYEPENTLLSFQRALDMKVDGIELDVHRCGTGEIVVIHDHTLERTTDGQGRVDQTSLADLKLLDAGDGEKIPTLEETIEFVHRRAVLFIELKDKHSAQGVAALITRFVDEKNWSYENFLVISFDHHEIKKVKDINPKIAIGATLVGNPVNYAEVATLCNAQSINPGLEFLDEGFMADARKRGLKVYTWTANDPDLIERAKALGVDGIISDFPDRL